MRHTAPEGVALTRGRRFRRLGATAAPLAVLQADAPGLVAASLRCRFQHLRPRTQVTRARLRPTRRTTRWIVLGAGAASGFAASPCGAAIAWAVAIPKKASGIVTCASCAARATTWAELGQIGPGPAEAFPGLRVGSRKADVVLRPRVQLGSRDGPKQLAQGGESVCVWGARSTCDVVEWDMLRMGRNALHRELQLCNFGVFRRLSGSS